MRLVNKNRAVLPISHKCWLGHAMQNSSVATAATIGLIQQLHDCRLVCCTGVAMYPGLCLGCVYRFMACMTDMWTASYTLAC